MYRSGKVYDEISKTIIQIYIDYDLKHFPINERDVCTKLGVALIPYSEFSEQERKLLLGKSSLGFFVKGSKTSPPTIFYNDGLESEGAIRFTVFHELKHYVYEDDDDSEDDLADYFSRYFMCPIPFLLLKNIFSINEIVSFCGVSFDAACNVQSNIINRKNRYGNKIFDYEVQLIEQLEPILLEIYE